RTQLANAVDLRADERRHLRLLAPRTRRPHREARDADDAPVLFEQIQCLGRLLREADDAARIVVGRADIHTHGSVSCPGTARVSGSPRMIPTLLGNLERWLFAPAE